MVAAAQTRERRRCATARTRTGCARWRSIVPVRSRGPWARRRLATSLRYTSARLGASEPAHHPASRASPSRRPTTHGVPPGPCSTPSAIACADPRHADRPRPDQRGRRRRRHARGPPGAARGRRQLQGRQGLRRARAGAGRRRGRPREHQRRPAGRQDRPRGADRAPVGAATGPSTCSGNPAVVVLVGLQGSGKTTSAAKLARHVVKQGRRPLLVAADPYRPAAVDQLADARQEPRHPGLPRAGRARRVLEIVAPGRRGRASARSATSSSSTPPAASPSTRR